MKRSFTVVVERDPESTWVVGEVVELPWCFSQARTCGHLRRMCRRRFARIPRALNLKSHFRISWAPGGLRWRLDPAQPGRPPRIEQGS